MVSVRGVVGRLRGDRLAEVERQVAATRETVLEIKHLVDYTLGVVAPMAQSIADMRDTIAGALAPINDNVTTASAAVARIEATLGVLSTVLLELNHDVRSGAEDSLPLFLGYTERLRLDTDTAIGAAQVIERQLALLEGLVDAAGASEQP